MTRSVWIAVVVAGSIGCKKSEEAPAAPPAAAPAAAAPAAAPVAAGDYHSKTGKYKMALACKQKEPPHVDPTKETFECEGAHFISVEWTDGATSLADCISHSDSASGRADLYKNVVKGDLPGGRGKFWKLDDKDGSKHNEWACVKAGDRTLDCEASVPPSETDGAKFLASCESAQAE